MARDSALTVSVGIVAPTLASAATYQANEVFAPLALALSIIALVWPLQSWLQARIIRQKQPFTRQPAREPY
jgi:predicted PurR-regulated permease PerM